MEIEDLYGEAVIPYWESLGRFIHSFAEVEGSLIDLLRRVTKTSRATSRAVFSGVRVDQAKGLIGRHFEAHGKKLPSFLTDAFSHLGDITSLRNDLLHYGTSVNGDGQLMITNGRVAHAPRSLRVTAVSSDIIDNATIDLWQIRVSIAIQGAAMRHKGQESEALQALIATRAQTTWLYKPRPPSQTSTKPLRKLRVWKPPPQS